MSDPVSNAEIEDVLASIRRLVSDEPGRVQRKPEAPRAAEPDKLILTPAQRVTGEDAVADAGESEGASDDEEAPAPVRGLRYDQTLAQRIAELESVISQSGADWEPDGSETETDATEPLGFAAASAEEILAPDAEDRTGDEMEEPVPAGTDPEVETWSSADAAVAAEPVQTGPEAPEHAAEAAEPEPLESHGDAPEEDIDRAGDFLDAEEGHDWTDAEEGQRWTDAAAYEAYEDEDHDDEAPEDDSEPSRLDLSGDSAVLDEEALRLMVSEMVRDELQGVLGERITRNVRRLVRREIQRALAARDIG